MKAGATDGRFDRSPAADLWRHTLSQVPTLFGRLVFLASLRDPNCGEYRHYGLSARFGDEQAAETLRGSHERAFSDWLCLPLAGQQADLSRYLDGLEEPRRKVLEMWLLVKSYRHIVPASAAHEERRLFCSDLEILLELLRAEAGVACPDPDAWPRR